MMTGKVRGYLCKVCTGSYVTVSRFNVRSDVYDESSRLKTLTNFSVVDLIRTCVGIYDQGGHKDKVNCN